MEDVELNAEDKIGLNTTTFISILEYMYTNWIPINEYNIVTISNIADFLKMPGK